LAEAAEIASCNVGTMKSRLHYALKALRARLPVERRAPVGTPAAVRVTTR
jgi:DNA-directed RNA polymerase specialized sigma24 family protein